MLVAAPEIRAGETVAPPRLPRRAGHHGRRTPRHGRARAHDVAEIDGSRRRRPRSSPASSSSRRSLRPRAARHGLRAMSIPIDPSRAVGGRLAPGDRVDVLFAGERAVSIVVAGAEVRGRRRARSRWHRGERESVHGDDRGVRTAVAAGRGGHRRRRGVACPHDRRSVERGNRPQVTRPRRRRGDRRSDGSMTAMEPTVALVFSPEQWVEELHRHLAHHGGARVRQIVVDPAVALDEEFDILVVSDRWPALTLGFVRAVHERGRQVLGVFDPDEPAGKDHLVTLGVDATIAADASMGEFVVALREARRSRTVRGRRRSRSRRTPSASRASARRRWSASPGPAVRRHHRDRGRPRRRARSSACPGRAGRRGTNRRRRRGQARSGARAQPAERGRGVSPTAWARSMTRSSHRSASRSAGVVAGFPSPVAAAQVTTHEVLDVVAELRASREYVVVDADGASDAGRRSARRLHRGGRGGRGASRRGRARRSTGSRRCIGGNPVTPLHLAVNRCADCPLSAGGDPDRDRADHRCPRRSPGLPSTGAPRRRRGTAKSFRGVRSIAPSSSCATRSPRVPSGARRRRSP